ncbi:MAG TPA: OB-fold nucleic acid binding domain-containing protein, partial [Acidimicrobiales bacterium]|nr:OB-fold nucleic acid binding domain-containing protein [Acidimicrobiales bacterium]
AGAGAGARRRQPTRRTDLARRPEDGAMPGATPIRDLRPRQPGRVAGRVRSVTVQPWAGVPNLEITLEDPTGRVLVVFLGRRHVPGVVTGARMMVEGVLGTHRGQPAIINPLYELLSAEED